MSSRAYDAIVVGSGPNGLAAAVTLARARLSVLLVEAAETLGGGLRSAELTLPGFVHDVCSAIHPLGVASPFFRSLPLGAHGLSWIFPEAEAAQPFTDRPAALLHRSPRRTAEGLGEDGPAWEAMVRPFLDRPERLVGDLLHPPWWPPRGPLTLARFGMHAVRSARAAAFARFRTDRARGLYAGLAAHAIVPLERPFTASFGLLFAFLAHGWGWPLARGGSRAIADALASCFGGLGGEARTGWPVRDLAELPPARAVLLDLTPRQVLAVAGRRLGSRYARALARYRYGAAAFKLDYALAGPVPWRDPACLGAGTVHVGGPFEEVAAAEAEVGRGRVPERPFLLVGQQSLFDPTRSPAGRHTLWAYCHVPGGSEVDMTERIEAQIERHAPGFRDLVLGRAALSPASLAAYNENYVGGDIAGGSTATPQLFFRPTFRIDPYATPDPGIFLCSSSTPPGAGVHGMCGYLAARSALRRAFGLRGSALRSALGGEDAGGRAAAPPPDA